MVRRSRKMAVVVGCNYPTVERLKNLHGCHNDAMVMQKTLVERFGFKPSSIKLMVDVQNCPPSSMPTGRNIKRELYSMIGEAQSGDVLFFYFSGHGMRSKVHNLDSIIATDDNLITCVDFRHMVDRVPKKATFTIMADSCTSGGLIDKEPVQIGPRRPSSSQDGDHNKTMLHDVAGGKMVRYDSFLQEVSSRTGLNSPDIGVHMLHLFGRDASLIYTLPPDRHPKPLKPDQGILLSASQPGEKSYECSLSKSVTGQIQGAFTNAFLMILKENQGSLTNEKIVLMARRILETLQRAERRQHPCLYCSPKNASAVFLGSRSSSRTIT